MKILIAIPCMDSVPTQFAQSLSVLKKTDNCGIAFQVGSLIYMSRNKLAALAIQKDCDYILWLDSDMVFPADVLEKLLEQADEKTIITGLYCRRVEPYYPVILKKLELTDEGNIFEDYLDIPKEPFEVEGCGFGCVLTPTKVFYDCLAEYGEIFAPIKGNGEDLSFCWRARQLGYKIVCDPRIYLGHVGHYVVDRGFYESYRAAKGETNES